eukprot:TRINITY_DN6599_c0_g1_i1.p1 TRINITY_DN6599_c0_g1~~TRINITY_DN6599_c0_g1_i1.p1  ORF type:complete len:121 (+),score=24.72 TRINITY_DN6599_c0_g1_i1:67-429(+)
MDTTLPERKVKFVFPQVPDFNDVEFDKNDPTAYFAASFQRYKEQFIQNAETNQLRQELRLCLAKQGINAQRNCKELLMAYYKRIKTTSDMDKLNFSAPDFTGKDDYLERSWYTRKNKPVI